MYDESIHDEWYCRLMRDDSDLNLFQIASQRASERMSDSKNKLIYALGRLTLRLIPGIDQGMHSLHFPGIDSLIYPDTKDPRIGCCVIQHMYWSDEWIAQITYNELRHNKFVQVFAFVHKSDHNMNSSNNIEDMVDLKNNILNGLFEKQMFRSTNCKTNAAIYMKELNSKINKRYFPDKPKNLAKKLYKSLGSR